MKKQTKVGEKRERKLYIRISLHLLNLILEKPKRETGTLEYIYNCVFYYTCDQ